MSTQVAEKLLRQKKRNDDDDDDFVATPAKTTKVKSARSSRRQSSFAPSPAITPIAEEEYMFVPTGVKDTGLTGKYWADMAEGGSAPEKGMSCLLSLRRILESGLVER